MNTGLLIGLGALLSGIGSMIAAVAGLRTYKKRAQDDCDKRIKELRRAFDRGWRFRAREDDERWSHLP